MLNLKLTTPDLSTTFSIVGYIEKDRLDYQVGYGYLDDDNNVWIYEKPDAKVANYPWFTLVNKELVFSERSDYDNRIFIRRNCVNIDIESIRDNIDKCISEYKKTPIPITDDAELYEVKNNDTCLTTLVKLYLNDTKTDLSALANMTDNSVTISNLKSSIKRTDLSLKNFIRWMNALSLKYTIIIEDNGDGISNLNGDRFVYQSDSNQVSRVSDKNKF